MVLSDVLISLLKQIKEVVLCIIWVHVLTKKFKRFESIFLSILR